MHRKEENSLGWYREERNDERVKCWSGIWISTVSRVMTSASHIEPGIQYDTWLLTTYIKLELHNRCPDKFGDFCQLIGWKVAFPQFHIYTIMPDDSLSMEMSVALTFRLLIVQSAFHVPPTCTASVASVRPVPLCWDRQLNSTGEQ